MGPCVAKQAAKDPRATNGEGVLDGERQRSQDGRGGYSVGQFVEDTLVPAELFTCRRPRDPKRAKDLKRELKELNDLIMESARKHGQTKGRQADHQHIKKQAIPAETICRVWLNKATAEGSFNHRMDLSQAAKLKVRVYGFLLFPPEVRWYPRHANEPQTQRREDAFDHRWRLNVEVWLLLEHAHAEDRRGGRGGDQPSLQVKCLHLKVQNEQDFNGDPVVDSWLPSNDILQDIEVVLDAKLHDAVSDITH
mmetsp:Transcript_37905/g.109299  ORF Transcript_37905/g.109299 Transcript_37905/m.109299 type:complete len:251 (-) Transcript_37905:101-853(-)